MEAKDLAEIVVQSRKILEEFETNLDQAKRRLLKSRRLIQESRQVVEQANKRLENQVLSSVSLS